jgi:hypothetical protein
MAKDYSTTYGIEQVKKLYARKDIDCCFLIRILDLKEAHQLGWHHMFVHPFVPTQELKSSGMYVLFTGIFGTGQYTTVSRHNNGDIFWIPSKRAGCLSIPCQGRKSGGVEPRLVSIDLPGNFLLGCNTLLDPSAL